MAASFTRFVFLATAAVFLGACQGENSPFAKADKPADGAVAAGASGTKPVAAQPSKAGSKSVKLVDRDVEAPEVFSATDTALWDGRPSLGGVWVASPDAVDPERVILRNAANGKFVIGALFRRERDNPGPTLQISSDAAAALGLLAGQPGKISVTALRREEAPVTAPDATKPILDAAETVATETLDPIAGAEAAIATAEAESKGTQKGLGLFKKKPVQTGGPVAPVVGTGIKTAAVAAAPLAATGTAPKTQTKPAPQSAAKAPAPAAGQGGGVIQIGIFSVEANAKRAADTLSKAGINAVIRAENAQGKPFWSVTASGGADGLAKVKAAGFGDAYMLKRG